MQEGGRLPEAEAQRLFQQCVAALAFCERRHVCHRDLKPENILLDTAHNAKIADFGLASVVSPGAQFMQYRGTPAFSAPETFAGGQYDGTAADVWSLGVMLYECLSGHLPFDADNVQQLVAIVRRCVPLPQALLPVVDSALLLRMNRAQAWPTGCFSGMCALQKRHGISTGLASSQSSSRKPTQTASGKATQTRTVRDTRDRRAFVAPWRMELVCVRLRPRVCSLFDAEEHAEESIDHCRGTCQRRRGRWWPACSLSTPPLASP